MSSKNKSKFVYQPRKAEDVRRQANQKGGMFDSIFVDGVQVLSVKEGKHHLRVMPPTWDGFRDFALEIWTHYGVGADNQKYLCLKKMKGEPCPRCEEYDGEQKRLGRDLSKADKEYLGGLRARKRFVAWCIDRKDEDAGPQLWDMPWTINSNINKLSIDELSGATLAFDHPDKGFDLFFATEGQGKNVQYTGLQLARKSTPLNDNVRVQDEWLDLILHKPVPTLLNYFTAEHISKVAAGESAKDDSDESDEEPKSRRSTSRDEDDRPVGKARRSTRDESDDSDEEPKARKRNKPDDDSDEEEPKARRPRYDESDDSDEEPKARKRNKPDDDSDDSDESEEENKHPTIHAGRAGNRPPADDAKTRTASHSKSDDSEEEQPEAHRRMKDDSDESEDEPRARSRESVKDKIRKAREG